ncbi:hypothetical protein [Sphingomonas glacialis]|uniref:Glycosyltransferase RgtA/B/C/D-like domain-containing protein n=1 Tax=Sphingomonas glacialis TaxID=658225 RepID=A0A502FU22_9SPHN|nr:hypothetical protein [Sphingomonas glacialis]TPG52921.1 hypothetical protein EAH76_13820 [Sphingomonas glacialis]
MPMPRWVMLFAVALLVRALTFGNPILHVDEEFYFATAQAIAHGAIPYVDVWDRKPVGLFLLYVPAAALGLPLGIWAYQALALASVTATATLIARLADRAGWAKGALPAAIAYLLWLNLLEGEGGQTPVFYNLLMVSAASLLAPRPDDAAQARRRFVQGCAALALVGLALQIKYTVVFEGLFFGLWWMWREWRLGQRWWRVALLAVPLAALAALPTLAALAWFWAHGHGDAFVYANFASIGARGGDPITHELGNLALMLLILSPLIAMAILAARCPSTEATRWPLRRWLFGWAIVAGLGVLVFRGYFDHYALPLLVPLCVCAAGFFAQHYRAIRVRAPLLIVVLLASQVVLLVKRHERGTPAQFAAITRSIGHGPGCLYVFSGSPMLYPMADRCMLTRYRFPRHIGQARERGAIGADQQSELERILALRPAVVVLGARYRGERAELRALFERYVAAHYRQRADLPLGGSRIAVYALR